MCPYGFKGCCPKLGNFQYTENRLVIIVVNELIVAEISFKQFQSYHTPIYNHKQYFLVNFKIDFFFIFTLIDFPKLQG